MSVHVDIWSITDEKVAWSSSLELYSTDYIYYDPILLGGNLVIAQQPNKQGVLFPNILMLQGYGTNSALPLWEMILPTSHHILQIAERGELLILNTVDNEGMYENGLYVLNKMTGALIWNAPAHNIDMTPAYTRSTSIDSHHAIQLMTSTWSDSWLTIHEL